MTRIKVLAETEKTVTLRRADFQALLQAAEDNADLAAIEKHRAEEKRLGWDVAKRNYLTREEAERALDGESLVRIWREKRGMTQGALAKAAPMSVSYLAEIEGGKKPGSRDALQRVALILEVPMESLAENSMTSFQPVTRSAQAAERLARLAEETGNRVRLSEEAHAVVREWIEIAERDGVRHQVKAAVGTLAALILQRAAAWTAQADDAPAAEAAERMKRISDALEAAWDELDMEYHKL